MAQRGEGGGRTGFRLSAKAVVWIVVAVLVAVFVAQNGDEQTITFLFFDWTVGTWVALLAAVLLGMALGWLLPRVLRDRG